MAPQRSWPLAQFIGVGWRTLTCRVPLFNGKKNTTDFSTNPVNLQYDSMISYSQNIPLLLEGGLGPQSTKAYRAAHGEQRNSTHSTGTLSGRQLEEASREILRFRSRFHGSIIGMEHDVTMFFAAKMINSKGFRKSTDETEILEVADRSISIVPGIRWISSDNKSWRLTDRHCPRGNPKKKTWMAPLAGCTGMRHSKWCMDDLQ